MNTDILNTIILAISFLSLFGVAELLYHKFKVKVELTRKLVHLGTGLFTLLFPVMLGNKWPVLFLCSGFAVILILSFKYNLLKSVNAIDRESFGSLCYPFSVAVCYLAFDYFNQQYIYFYLPILILAICDPIAALTGKKWPKGKFKIGNETKTLMGASMFFLSAFIVIVIVSKLSGLKTETTSIVFSSGIIAFIATISEALSRKGYDNITIPLSVLITLVILF